LLRHDLIKIGAEMRAYTANRPHHFFLNQEPKWQQTKRKGSRRARAVVAVVRRAASRKREHDAGLTAES
jgi:hypothetical protein